MISRVIQPVGDVQPGGVVESDGPGPNFHRLILSTYSEFSMHWRFKPRQDALWIPVSLIHPARIAFPDLLRTIHSDPADKSPGERFVMRKLDRVHGGWPGSGHELHLVPAGVGISRPAISAGCSGSQIAESAPLSPTGSLSACPSSRAGWGFFPAGPARYSKRRWLC